MSRFALAFVALLVAQVASAQDYSNVTSGMLLGIYSTPAQGGMRVTSLIEGYSAVGRIEPGDVLLRVAVSEQEVYRLRSTQELEAAKTAIGPNREAALELWRPEVGLIYAWVEFAPLYAPASQDTSSTDQTTEPAPMPGFRAYGAQFKLESEKQGARAMFQATQGGGRQRDRSIPRDVSNLRQQVQQAIGNTPNARSVFGR